VPNTNSAKVTKERIFYQGVAKMQLITDVLLIKINGGKLKA